MVIAMRMQFVALHRCATAEDVRCETAYATFALSVFCNDIANVPSGNRIRAAEDVFDSGSCQVLFEVITDY